MFFLTTPETQFNRTAGAGGSFCKGFCGLDGHSQAPRDGFRVSREKIPPALGNLLKIKGNQDVFYIV
jgi:hypothetical protein